VNVGERCWQDELESVEYGSDVDKTQLSLDLLQSLKHRTHDLHPEVQVCCSFKVLLLVKV